jgi:hypothetical protein
MLLVILTGILAPAATPIFGQEEPGLSQLVSIEYLKRTVSRERVTQGEEFYISMDTRVTLARKLNIPWEVTGEYQVFGIHLANGIEVVLGEGVSYAGPFGEIQAGESISYEHRVTAAFPIDAPLGNYTIYVRPVKVSPWFFWLAYEALAPDQARLGEVEVGPPPTTTPTPTSTPPSLPPPSPAITPVTVAPAQTTSLSPTPAPPISTTPTPAPSSGGTPWRAIVFASLVVAVVAGAAILRKKGF